MIVVKYKKRSILEYQLLLLLLIGVFNVLPTVFPNTASFVFILIFAFTAVFFGVSIRAIFLKSKNYFKIKNNFLYYFLFFYLIIMLVINLKLDYTSLRELFLSPYVFLPYLLPFVIVNLNENFFNHLIKIVTYGNIFYIFFVFYFLLSSNVIINISFVEDLNKYFSFPNIILLFFYFKLSNKQKALSLIVFFIGFLLAILNGRRSLTWTYSWALIFFFYLNYFNPQSHIIKKIRFFVILMVGALFMIFIYEKYYDALFGNLINRIDFDSRSSVEKDFLNDMSTNNWIFGKGIFGTYKLVETDFLFDSDGSMLYERKIIESGYQNIILHGGIILYSVYLLIILVAIYRGLFVMKSRLGKGFAFFIILYLLESYPAGILTFNLRFFILWVGIFICWNKGVLYYNGGIKNLI